MSKVIAYQIPEAMTQPRDPHSYLITLIEPDENSDLTDALSVQRMSTREIAQLTGKRHDNVLRDATTMLLNLFGSKLLRETRMLLNAKQVKRSGKGKTYQIDSSILSHEQNQQLTDVALAQLADLGFNLSFDARGYVASIELNQDLSITSVTGYNVKLRYAIVKRWLELERKELVTSASDAIDAAIRSARHRELNHIACLLWQQRCDDTPRDAAMPKLPDAYDELRRAVTNQEPLFPASMPQYR